MDEDERHKAMISRMPTRSTLVLTVLVYLSIGLLVAAFFRQGERWYLAPAGLIIGAVGIWLFFHVWKQLESDMAGQQSDDSTVDS